MCEIVKVYEILWALFMKHRKQIVSANNAIKTVPVYMQVHNTQTIGKECI